MEWIKITKETDLPDESRFVFAYTYNDKLCIEEAYTQNGVLYTIDGYGVSGPNFTKETYHISDLYTHYCIITPPKD